MVCGSGVVFHDCLHLKALRETARLPCTEELPRRRRMLSSPRCKSGLQQVRRRLQALYFLPCYLFRFSHSEGHFPCVCYRRPCKPPRELRKGLHFQTQRAR